jgi:phosphoglycolate phosphatase-like HAD superfamily hydrolase
MKRLLLWDIDGTLIASGGAGMRALRTGLHAAFGVDGPLDQIDFAGRTDTWIMRQVFQSFNLPATAENFDRFFACYVAALPAALENPQSRVLPGVRALLAALTNRGDTAQGLLTGNMRVGARAKLEHHRLWSTFAFGAFADDSEDRNELGPHALRRAREHHGVEFRPDQTWIIGDTPHDIACGRAIGARTLAVATGGSTLAELQRHGPTAAVADLSDTAAIVRLLTEG